jgi:hypothetical protein
MYLNGFYCDYVTLIKQILIFNTPYYRNILLGMYQDNSYASTQGDACPPLRHTTMNPYGLSHHLVINGR